MWGSKGVWSSTEYGAEAFAEEEASPVMSRLAATKAVSAGAYPVNEQANKPAAKKAPSVPLSAWAPSSFDQTSLSAKEVIARAAAGVPSAADATAPSHVAADANSSSMGAVIDLLVEQLRVERQRTLAAEDKVAELEKKNEELRDTVHDAQAAAILRLERENERLSRSQAPK